MSNHVIRMTKKYKETAVLIDVSNVAILCSGLLTFLYSIAALMSVEILQAMEVKWPFLSIVMLCEFSLKKNSFSHQTIQNSKPDSKKSDY